MSHSTKKLGWMFTVAGWVLAMLILAFAFSKILDRQNNPNRSLATLQTGEFQEVVLKRNRGGHYVFDGEINRQKVTFLVDTGATTTSIPGNMHEALGLELGAAMSVTTANGTATAYWTRLDQLAIGEIEFNNIAASVVPGMRTDEVLLGMNVLKHFELVQRGDALIIRQYR